MRSMKEEMQAYDAACRAPDPVSGHYRLVCLNLEEQIKEHMAPFEYTRVHASTWMRDDGVVIPITHYITHATREQMEDGSAVKRWAGILSDLHAKSPIQAVLAGLANSIELSDGRYAIVSYLARENYEQPNGQFGFREF